jgi:hypothetical protein
MNIKRNFCLKIAPAVTLSHLIALSAISAQNPGTYELVTGIVNPVCHEAFWSQADHPNFTGGISGVLQYPHPNTTGYRATLGGSLTAFEGTVSEALLSVIHVRTWIKYNPVSNEVPLPVEVYLLPARSGSVRIVSGDSYSEENGGEISFGGQLSTFGGDGANESVYNGNNPYSLTGNFFGDQNRFPAGLQAQWSNSSGQWVSSPTAALFEITVTGSMTVTPKFPPRATNIALIGRYAKAFKPVYIDTVQIDSGWVPEDINADNEIGPIDFEIVVANMGADESAGNWSVIRFADTDKDGEIGPSDFEKVVAAFGKDVNIDLGSPGTVTNTWPYYNWMP